jgi:putative serine protease PepD
MTFKDVPETHWARGAIDRAASLELLKGYPDETFKPDQPVTRAETAAIAMRLYDRTEDSFEDVLSRVDPAIVQIEAGNSLGSGTSIGRGYVLTNAHVVGKSKRVGIRWPHWGYGEQGNAQYAEGPVVFVAPEVDLAIVRADIVQYRETMPTLPLGKPEEVRRGMPVLVAGSPLGFTGSVSAGIVSYVGRYMTYELQDKTKVTIPDAIQVDAAINPGNSGGALVNLKGELIGVPSVKLVDLAVEGMGFAIGLETVRQTIARAEQSGALAVAHRTELVAALRDQGLAIA